MHCIQYRMVSSYIHESGTYLESGNEARYGGEHVVNE
jgi:hypothetical protein